ncbi:hypothetical protein MASR2M70_18740 [Bacillota bacterium]
MAKDFFTAISERRSHYSIGNQPVTSDERIAKLLEQASLQGETA